MSDTGNLIDLGDETDESVIKNPSESCTQTTTISCLQTAINKERDSFDNNPFDRAQKLANRRDDPFDIVEKEAEFKARNCLVAADVKLAKLLSFDDESLEQPDIFNTASGHDMATSSGVSLYQTALSQDLERESPPTSMMKPTPDSVSYEGSGSSTDGSPGSGTAGGSGSKTKKMVEYRKRLLKLSISNSTFNSPVAHPHLRQGAGVVFLEGDSCCSPISTCFASNLKAEGVMLAAESPLQLIEDDLLAEEPPNFLDSDRDFDADLEQLKIPILRELPSPMVEQTNPPTLATPTPATSDNSGTAAARSIHPNLDSLRAKMCAKRHEQPAAMADNIDSGLDLTQVIKNLKSLICDIDVVDDNRRQQANCLLETLSSALVTDESESEAIAATITPQVPQQGPIMREGTYALDLYTEDGEATSDQTKPANPVLEGIPEAMLKSSATYDGETAEEKADLQLPEVDPMYAMAPSLAQSDVSDLLEQLGKLLGQHHSSNNTTGATINSAASQASPDVNNTLPLNGTLNPTFIVVMQQPAALQPSYARYNDGTAELHSPSASGRRRSQSLSLHDKVKIMQLPMQPPSQAVSPTDLEDSPPDAVEFKTPLRTKPRRNSFTSGTPYTPLTRRSQTSLDAISKPSMNYHSRHSTALSTHMEGRQQSLQQPLALPHGNMSSFKPDLRKKPKTNFAAESILKSSGPLKATIPVKKVAPMIKVTMPLSDDDGAVARIHLNQSTVGYPNACSTPQVNGAAALRRTSIGIQRPRYSTVAAPSTPNVVRTATAVTTHSVQRRRSPAELSMISPSKSRYSTSNTPSGRTLAVATRYHPKAPPPPPSLGRAPIRTAALSSASRPVTHRVGSRPSIGGAAPVCKNKENKQP